MVPMRPRRSRPSPLTVVADPPASDYVPPSPEHRQTADAYLRGSTVASPMGDLLASVTAKFTLTHYEYVRLARDTGEGSADWETISRVIAQDLAREAVQR